MPDCAGCGVQTGLTGAPSTPPTAHSMWGHRAEGAECTYRTPLAVLTLLVRVVTSISFISGASYAFPSGLDMELR